MLRRLFRNPLSLLGAVLITAAVVIAVACPLLRTGDPMHMAIASRLQPPSQAHWFGTDHLGRDIYTRVLYGSRSSLGTAAGACLLAFAGGGLLGLVSGFAGGRTDMWLMRATDVLLAFPSLLLAIGISAALGQGGLSIGIALWLVYLPRFARLARAAALEIRSRDFVLAATAAGATSVQIAGRHIVPNILSPIAVQISVYFSEMILAEAALNFLGLGTPPPAPTWGNILSDGREFMVMAPWISVFPGLFILLSVLGTNLLGDGLRDVLDPSN